MHAMQASLAPRSNGRPHVFLALGLQVVDADPEERGLDLQLSHHLGEVSQVGWLMPISEGEIDTPSAVLGATLNHTIFSRKRGSEHHYHAKFQHAVG